MTIREEIEKTIKEKNPLYSQLPDIVLAEVTKLIDSKLEQHEKERVPKDYYGRMPTAFNQGYFKALQELKEALNE